MVTLSNILTTSSDLVIEASFVGYLVSYIMVGRKKFCWLGLACGGVRLSGGVLFLFKCLGCDYTGVSGFGVYQEERSFHAP